MAWPHKAAFNAAPLKNLTFDSNDENMTVGEMRTSNGFSFLRMFEAGHMVPRDQPANALAMMEAFISGKI